MMSKYDAALILCEGSRDEDEATARLIREGWGFCHEARAFAGHLFGKEPDGIDIALWCWKGLPYGGPLPAKECTA